MKYFKIKWYLNELKIIVVLRDLFNVRVGVNLACENEIFVYHYNDEAERKVKNKIQAQNRDVALFIKVKMRPKNRDMCGIVSWTIVYAVFTLLGQ